MATWKAGPKPADNYLSITAWKTQRKEGASSKQGDQDSHEPEPGQATWEPGHPSSSLQYKGSPPVCTSLNTPSPLPSQPCPLQLEPVNCGVPVIFLSSLNSQLKLAVFPLHPPHFIVWCGWLWYRGDMIGWRGLHLELPWLFKHCYGKWRERYHILSLSLSLFLNPCFKIPFAKTEESELQILFCCYFGSES